MSNFSCEKCGTNCYDTPYGYVTGCEHYPIEKKTRKRIKALKENSDEQEMSLLKKTHPLIIDSFIKERKEYENDK